jgi:hypothetical protein
VKTSIRQILERDGALDTIGDDHFLPDVDAAVSAALRAPAATGEAP